MHSNFLFKINNKIILTLRIDNFHYMNNTSNKILLSNRRFLFVVFKINTMDHPI